MSSNGIPTVNDILENLPKYSFGNFDCIAMFHVLEHFYDPNRALKVCGDVISDNGMLVIIVPNILLPYRSLDRYFLRYVHPSNFSPQTLHAMLNKHGFTIVHSQLQGDEYWYQPHSLFVIARKQAFSTSEWSPPLQTADEVLKILAKYRLVWAGVKGPRWHIWHLRQRGKRYFFRFTRFLKHRLKERFGL